MIDDRLPELQSKWNKAFWTRGHSEETIGNMTDESVKRYIKKQVEELCKDYMRSTAS